MSFIVHNVLGQDVNFDPETDASGIYLLSDEAISQGLGNCPNGMRPGLLHIRGLETIPTCGGRIYTEQLPDIHLVDWRYRKYVQMLLLALAVTMLAAIIIKMVK